MINSQEKKIADLLLAGGKITQLEAFRDFNCSRLAARIHDLKSMGLAVEKEMIKTKSGKLVAQYSLNQ